MGNNNTDTRNRTASKPTVTSSINVQHNVQHNNNAHMGEHIINNTHTAPSPPQRKQPRRMTTKNAAPPERARKIKLQKHNAASEAENNPGSLTKKRRTAG